MATETVRPASNAGPNEWSTSGFDKVDDEVDISSSAGDGTLISAGKNDDNTQENFNTDPVSLVNVTSLALKFRARDSGADTGMSCNLVVNGTAQAVQGLNLTSSYVGYTKTFSGSWASITSLVIRFSVSSMGSDDDVDISLAYVEVTGDAAPSTATSRLLTGVGY